MNYKDKPKYPFLSLSNGVFVGKAGGMSSEEHRRTSDDLVHEKRLLEESLASLAGQVSRNSLFGRAGQLWLVCAACKPKNQSIRGIEYCNSFR